MTDPESVIYLDHGATSWPKPPQALERLETFFASVAANAGRSGHRASAASARMVFDCRERLAALLAVTDSRNLVFTRNATEALNLVLKGFLRQGDRVLISPMEHNAVARPLDALSRERRVRVDFLPADAHGRVDWEQARRLPADPPPRLVAIAHASNVNGAIQDLAGAKSVFPSAALLVDAAQTAGVLDIDVTAQSVDFLACSFHKGLLGPTGLGACYLHPDQAIPPLLQGGTGSSSESTTHPDFRPDIYEAGTQNLHGIAAALGGLDHLEAEGVSGAKKQELTKRLLHQISENPRIHVQSPLDGTALLASIRLEGLDPGEAARRLEAEFNILCRPGLHCAPLAHRHLQTAPRGTLRLAPGYGNTDEHMDRAAEALRKIAEG